MNHREKKRVPEGIRPLIHLLMLLTILAVLPAGAAAVRAADGAAAGLRQTEADNTSVTIEWPAEENVEYRILQAETMDGTYREIEGARPEDGEFTLENLLPGSSCYLKVRAVSGGVQTDSEALEAVTMPYGSCTVTQTKIRTTSVSFSWTEIPGATAYSVWYYPYGEMEKAVTKVTAKRSMTLKKLSPNVSYTVLVYAIRTNAAGTFATPPDLSAYGASYAMPTLPEPVSGISCDVFWPAVGSAQFSWKRQLTAHGYQYVIYDYKAKKKIYTATVSRHSYESTYTPLNTLKPNTFYAIRVRSYVLMNGKKKYSEWSKLHYFGGSGKTDYITMKTANKKLSLKWQKVKGASYYNVYVSTEKPAGLAQMTCVKKKVKATALTVKKLNGKWIQKKGTYWAAVEAVRKSDALYPNTIYYILSNRQGQVTLPVRY